jgi:pimeloyl-ACP methyl ester carboxylesterase
MSLVKVPGVETATRGVFELLSWLDTSLAIDRGMILGMFESMQDATSRRAFVRTLRAVVDWRGQVVTMLDRCYLTAGMPTLLVWGSRDSTIPLEHGRIAQAAMPGSRLEVFEGAGHFPHITYPERVLAVIHDFLATTEPTHFSPQEWRMLLRMGRRGVEAKMPPSVSLRAPRLHKVAGQSA